jgi:hypothetical protein
MSQKISRELWPRSLSMTVLITPDHTEYRDLFHAVFIELGWWCYLLTYLRTYSCYRVLLEKLTGLQLVKKFPAFYGTRRYSTALTSVHHLSLPCASSIQSIPPHPTSWRSILIILSSHLLLGLPSPGPRLCLWMFRNKIRFDGEEFLALRPTTKLEDNPLSAVSDCLFNIFAATLHIGGRSSIRNLRACHAVATRTHLSHGRNVTPNINNSLLTRSAQLHDIRYCIRRDVNITHFLSHLWFLPPTEIWM